MQCTQDFAAFGNLIGSQLKANGTPSPFNLDDAIVWYNKWLNIQLKLNVISDQVNKTIILGDHSSETTVTLRVTIRFTKLSYYVS